MRFRCAGFELERRNDTTLIAVNVKTAIIPVPAASPSTPSARFVPFAVPAMTMKMNGYQAYESGMFTLKIGRKTLVLNLQMVGDDADDHCNHHEQQHLPAAGEPERAPVRELDEVVEEADRAARERREEHRQPLQGVVRDREKRERRREQDHQAAHRGRAGLRE